MRKEKPPQGKATAAAGLMAVLPGRLQGQELATRIKDGAHAGQQFVRQPGVVLSRRQLLQDVFGTSNDGYARNVDCHVTRLRRKLEAAGLTPAPIRAVHGAGYRLSEA